MSPLFVADVHLCARRPQVTDAFLDLLTRIPAGQDLYILGDLFELWVGDDGRDLTNLRVIGALGRLRDRGVTCHLIRGNRDLLLGRDFAGRCGLDLLPEPQIVTAGNYSTLILHGDAMCAGVRYQIFRRLIDRPWVRRGLLSLPLAIRSRIGRGLSHLGKICGDGGEVRIDADRVSGLLKRSGIRTMIHGHVHHPGLHLLEGGCRRLVVGAWYLHRSMIEMDDAGFRYLRADRISFPPLDLPGGA